MAMPKPAVNPLEDLFQLISKGSMQKDIEFRGKVYTFRSLYDEDYVWRDQYVNMNGPVSMASSQRSPTLAIACVAIDGVPVEQLDDLNEKTTGLPAAALELIRENQKYLIAYNLHDKVFSKLPRDYVIELYSEFVKQVEIPARTVKADDVKN
jgi:hypothetical protein